MAKKKLGKVKKSATVGKAKKKTSVPKRIQGGGDTITLLDGAMKDVIRNSFLKH